MRTHLLLAALLTGCSASDDKADGSDTGSTDSTSDTGVADSAASPPCEGVLDPSERESEPLLDCDRDGVEDAEAIASGTAMDTDNNQVPDACQLLEGHTHYGRENYVSWEVGSLPIVLLAPHGGSLEPDEIPIRDQASAKPDLYTYELSQAISEAFHSATGRRPHLVACHVHRYRLDCNRDKEEGAENNPFAEQAWEEFHGFIERAKTNATAVFGRALVLDIHGMSRDRIEIGMLTTGDQLLQSDERLRHDAYRVQSSIRSLVESSSKSYPSLLRGSWSLGGLLRARGYEALPSPATPDPGQDSEGEALSYFRGGYNTWAHGSQRNEWSDAIQLEHPLSLRQTEASRESYAADLVDSVLDFLSENSPVDLSTQTALRMEAADPVLSETGNTALLRLYRTGDRSNPLDLKLRFRGEVWAKRDIETAPEWTFPANQAVLEIPLAALDDDEVEGAEAFEVELDPQDGLALLGDNASFWIADDEQPSVWVHSVIPSLLEDWTSTAAIARDFCDSEVRVDVAWSGEVDTQDVDISTESPLLFEEGVAAVELPIDVLKDDTPEGFEQMAIRLSSTEIAELDSPAATQWVGDIDLEDSLQAWWDFEGLAAPEEDRVSRQELQLLPSDSPPAVETNPTASPSAWLAFDGTEDVAIPRDPPSPGTSSMELSLRFRARPESEETYSYLVSWGSVAERSSLNLYLTPSGWLRTGLRGEEDDWNYRALDVQADLRDGDWHSYRLHVDWINQNAQVHLDGVLAAEHALGAGGFSNSKLMHFGGRSDLSPLRHFEGDLAAIRIASE